MKHLIRDFISHEPRTYRVKLGQLIASGLSGFVVGVITASIIWMAAFYYINTFILSGDGSEAPDIKETLLNR